VPLTADPKRSPFRIYRDVRFAKDKSPYKTNVAASFQYVGDSAGTDAGARADAESRYDAGGYFHLSPGDIWIGGGMWHPEPAWLAAFRRTVAERPAEVHRAIDAPAFKAEFGELSTGHERLKRPPAGFPADHPDVELLKLKDITFGRRLADDDAYSPDLPDRIARSFESATPVFRLLSSIRPA
jgi:uncharacterized protein (TIGR02453 family)